MDKADEPSIRAKIAQIKTRLNVKEIHLQKVGDFFKRAYIVRELKTENFVYMNVLVDTGKLDQSKIPSPIITYNYVCKYLLQRVSWYLHDAGKTADIVLSAKGTERDGKLIQYIQDKLFPYKGNSIDKKVFGNVCAKGAGSWDLLQLADVCATTMYLTYEPNRSGFYVPCFSSALESHLYRKGGKVESYGIKFFTEAMQPDIEGIRKLRVCAK